MKKNIIINNVTLYYLTDESLRKALENPNSIILIASSNDVFTPVFFQRYADYIDKKTLESLQLVEAFQPYIIDFTKYPISFNYYHKLGDIL